MEIEGEEINTTHLEQLLIHNDDIFQTSLNSEDYLESLAPIIKDSIKQSSLSQLIAKLNLIVVEKDEELNKLSEISTNDIIASIDSVELIDSNSQNIRSEFMNIVNNLDKTGFELTILKKNFVKFKNVSDKINDTSTTLNLCLQVLELTNKVHELIKDKKYFNALKNLDDLTNVHLHNVEQFSFSKKILDSIPTLRKMIKEDSFENVTKWLSILEKKLFQIGDSLFENIETILSDWNAKKGDLNLSNIKMNSPIELSLRDPKLELDILNDESLQVDLSTIYDCILVYQTINEEELLRVMYQKEWLKKRDRITYPLTNNTNSNSKIQFNFSTLNEYLHKIAGFFIMDKLINFNTQFKLRTDLNSDDLWDSLVSKMVPILSNFVKENHDLSDLENLKKILGNFIHIMINYNYKVDNLYTIMVVIFEQYCDLLYGEFDLEFKESITKDDSMPIVLDNSAEYDKLIEYCWYKPSEAEFAKKFPKSVPFSSIYLDYCFQIRSFINKLLVFINDYYSIELNQLNKITIDKIDKILNEIVCNTILSSIDSSNREQISQIFINLEYFINSSVELGKFLTNLKISANTSPKKITLNSVESFKRLKKNSEDTLFKMVNSKISDLLELADYDWSTDTRNKDPTFFAKDIGQYLESMFLSTFAKLPHSVKTSLLLRAFDTLTQNFYWILKDCHSLTKIACENFNLDMIYIRDVVDHLNSDSSLDIDRTPKDGVSFRYFQQLVNLLSHGDIEDYKNIEKRTKSYFAIPETDALSWLSKIVTDSDAAIPTPPTKTSRFGNFSFRRDFSS